jgi:hypothetical protein
MDLSAAVWRKSSFSGGAGGQCVEVADNLPGAWAAQITCADSVGADPATRRQG